MKNNPPTGISRQAKCAAKVKNVRRLAVNWPSRRDDAVVRGESSLRRRPRCYPGLVAREDSAAGMSAHIDEDTLERYAMNQTLGRGTRPRRGTTSDLH